MSEAQFPRSPFVGNWVVDNEGSPKLCEWGHQQPQALDVHPLSQIAPT